MKYTQLENKIDEMKINQHEMEQYERNKNIEINGLDEIRNESTHDVIKKLAKAFVIEDFKPDTVEKAHRIPNKNKDKTNSFIVQFKNREARDKWIEAKKKIVTNDQLLQNGNGRRVFINEHMTPYYRQLFWKTKNHAKENNIKFVWFKNGKVLTRVSADEKKVVVIRSENDLKQVV